jgi:O-antigen/teichoic acid export membrane protein
MLFRFSSNVILAYLLSPESFGMMAIIIPIITGLQLMSDVGSNALLIKSPNSLDPKFYNTIFTVNLLRGFVLFLIVTFVSSPIAVYYKLPELELLLAIAGITLFLKGMECIGQQLAIREHKLKKVILLDLVCQLIAALTSITLASLYHSAWPLVIGMVFGSIIKVVLSYFMFSGYHIKLCLDVNTRKEIFSLGKWIFLSTLFGFLATQFDKFFLAKEITLERLGVYYIAATLAMIPVELMNKIASNVLYPLYSQLIRDNHFSKNESIQNAREVMLCFMFNITALLLAGSGVFFNTLYK